MKEVFKKCGEFIFEKENKDKPWFKRRVVWFGVALITTIVLIVAIASGNTKKQTSDVGKEIPNVFGVYYEDAIEVLEAEGFEVNAIETDAQSIFHNLYEDEFADLRPKYLEKGAVFKIDDYTQRGDGSLMKNDDIMFDGIFSPDNTLVVYYAKHPYYGYSGSQKDGADEEMEITEESEEENTDLPAQTEEPKKQEQKSNTSRGEISSEFKSAMDSYEKFFDEYVAIMKKYANNPSDTSILKDYTKYMGKYAQMMSDFEKWESEDMNTAETAYYIEVQGRITKKLLEIAQ